ncbi:hypothetical protein [Micromonospora sp. NPDC004704]
MNLATIATGVLAILLLAWLGKVSWRGLISSPQPFDYHRLAQ